jgi:hypothetical protein
MSGIKRSRERVTKNCKQCQNPFTVANYRKDTALFCSRKCLALSSRQELTTPCEICGTVFTHIASRANKAKYCSRKCYHKAQINRGTKEYVCAHCGVTFFDSPSHKRKYCSKKCVNKASKEIWKPDFTTVRKQMLRRGMLVSCQRCGFSNEPKILGVHHKDRNRDNNAVENLEVLCPNCHSIEHNKHICHGFSG